MAVYKGYITTEYVSDEYLHINSCGITYRFGRDTGTCRMNGRADYHILYISQGCCYTEIDSREVKVNEGNLILFRPGVTQKYYFRGEDNAVSCYIHFTGTACDELLAEIGLDMSSVIYIGKSHTVKSIFEKMSKEYILKKACFQKMCAAYTLELFAVIGRRLSSVKAGNGQSSSTLADKACLLMHEKYMENLPLDYYADYCSISTSRFSHIFKEATGTTPLDYIIRIRISKAKDFLVGSDISISEIAELVGFSNQNYFGRIFKKYEGVSPRKYARMFLDNKNQQP
ncbi:MAG: helix-turn-helix transcriptional regulator [Clostridia bacterium]|nr:helix-turn-helix transcriptional regulator [Clostridia bacterium]